MSATHNSDLQRDLSSSIAVKITAPVLWVIITVGVLVAIILQGNIKTELSTELNVTADFLAYQLQQRLNKTQGELVVEDRLWLRGEIESTSISAITLTVGNKITLLGENEPNWPVISRDIHYAGDGSESDRNAILILSHPPLDDLIRDYRRQLLVKAGIPFLIFAIVLAGLIHVSVTRPITELVNATQAVTKGNLSERINFSRHDEFGHLGRFFNEMLDKLQSQQQQLSEAVKAAEAASSAKSSFLANMSHEIRTPLTAIIGFSEMLRGKDLSEEQRQREVEAIIRSGKHLQQIINDILDFSKIEAGQLVIENIFVAPTDLLEDISSLFQTRAEEKGLKLNLRIEYPMPRRIRTDPTRLKQILMNLCSNAIKFTERGSVSLLVRYVADENSLLVSVTDTGIGMNENEQQHIFLPFTQADVSTTRRFGGTGLGLCISNELAVKLGGGITCQSKKGIGTQFVVKIDAGEVSEEELILSAEELGHDKIISDSAEEQLTFRGRVLLAEDNEDNQRLLGFYLQRAGIDFVCAKNGAEAVKYGLAETFDLVLMDMQMPVMDGLSAIRLLRQQNFNKPIIVLTANVLAEDREACKKVGANDFLTKPVDVKRFYAVLDQYLDKRIA